MANSNGTYLTEYGECEESYDRLKWTNQNRENFSANVILWRLLDYKKLFDWEVGQRMFRFHLNGYPGIMKQRWSILSSGDLIRRRIRLRQLLSTKNRRTVENCSPVENVGHLLKLICQCCYRHDKTQQKSSNFLKNLHNFSVWKLLLLLPTSRYSKLSE